MAKYLDRRDSSQYIREKWGICYSPKTLTKMATTGGGPQYIVVGGRALSQPGWLDAWIESKLTAPRYTTSEVA
jgi:hypothetical protein